ncbi:SUMF1/EgtB/PvdO family nonheme iron enzyme (plasmid) [Mesorhizobium sp. AR10]|uniref:SUMF1/EgtB/PvdO family nonheme iron enzyme n=1 Tax=Mesorhizobium sp. AR10 TaxID=2865839 RepID=UPI00215E53C9|nr:SUMF1/EgtB/PvdO family nonheme iron enzyme [Mesorhizobium sp. AR10]UVK35798.1 SUMF1/EgtB/PvdO family nonheme iron enzyme [Mesorhizobium sp. AR10]
MARYAVTFASNGPATAGSLRYAESDAERFSAALESERCNFSVRRLGKGCTRNGIEDAIDEVAQNCTDADTFVVYFSGHGFIDRAALLLMLDETSAEKPLTSAMHVDSIVRSMRFCKARHKLLILDCCHAGMVFADSRFKDQVEVDMKAMVSREDAEAASFVALLASDRLEKAREFDELGGSFLSATICDALESDTMAGDVDGDGAIDLRDLQEWLTFQARERNRDVEDAVPVPFIYGRERGRLYITRDPTDWPRVEVTGANGHKFVPVRLLEEGGHQIWLIGTTPVTNGQYREFVKGTRHHQPRGRSFNNDGPDYWIEGFKPWRHPDFSAPEKPVVCVSLQDAMEYASWLSRKNGPRLHITVAPPDIWDMAAFGHPYPSFDKRLWLREDIHHKAKAPSAVDDPSRQPNRYGARDLFGNVWEWTSADFTGGDIALGVDAAPNWRERNQELRGGGFLDDLGVIRPVLAVGVLEESSYTRHYDLGFRLAALIDLDAMPTEIRARASSALRRSPRRSLEGYGIPATA